MATSRRNQNYTYRTYGSVAYAPAYDGSAVRAPGREQVLQPKPKQKRKVKVLTRTQVQVREAGLVSPFAVVGFALVGVFAALLQERGSGRFGRFGWFHRFRHRRCVRFGRYLRCRCGSSGV
jgi:hypothetical protein